jgi:hypothetical protein
MVSNVVDIRPPASAAVEQVEPIEVAVREVSAAIAQNNDERRRRTRPTPPAMTEPVTFFSIEEAGAPSTASPLQVARGGR